MVGGPAAVDGQRRTSALQLLLGAVGAFSLSMVFETLVLVPMVFLGTWTGTRFFRTSSPERFYTALQALLLCAALAITAKGLLRLV